MRTTIELSDEQRALLLKLAAERGEKGFSRLIQEAVDRYLKERHPHQEKVAKALAALGSLDDEEAEELRASVKDLRERWR